MREITALASGLTADICDRFRHHGLAWNYFLPQAKGSEWGAWSAYEGLADTQEKLRKNAENDFLSLPLALHWAFLPAPFLTPPGSLLPVSPLLAPPAYPKFLGVSSRYEQSTNTQMTGSVLSSETLQATGPWHLSKRYSRQLCLSTKGIKEWDHRCKVLLNVFRACCKVAVQLKLHHKQEVWNCECSHFTEHLMTSLGKSPRASSLTKASQEENQPWHWLSFYLALKS